MEIGQLIPTPDETIIASSPLNDADEVAIQSFLVDFNTHPDPNEFNATGVNGYFQWWRARRAASKPEDVCKSPADTPC
ncbi:hypothetical protein [Halomonas sp. C22]|uniref:hypothetical protein n=1 Tax=Halomonas sp. C22 TaxID=2580567 RepID=UPI0011A04582|nr:hypothetical protein [Halomonas sp. C22]